MIDHSKFIYNLYDRVFRYRNLNPFIGYPLRNKNKEFYNPFFIIGSGRSGSTLLRRMLHAHSQLFIPPETYVLGKIIRLFIRYRTMKWNDLVHLIYSNFQFHPEFYTFGIDNLSPLVLEVSQCPESNRSLAFIIDNFYKYYAKVHGIEKEKWGDKTPLNTFHLNKIKQVFPSAKFIHIIRDGCDVVYSYVRAGIYKDYESAAQRWKLSVELAKRFGEKNLSNYLEVKYEDLVTNPEGTIKIVCQFLEISYEEENMLHSEKIAKTLGDVICKKHHSKIMKKIDKSSVGKGRNALSLNDKMKLQQIIGKYLVETGYKSCLEQ